MAQRPDVPGYPGLPELSGGHLVIPRPRPPDTPADTATFAVLPGSLGERLRAARDRVFVGRERELAAFRRVLRDGGVLGLHGPGGIGKSTLLRRLADLARDEGRVVTEIDCRTIDPTPAAFAAEALPSTVLLVDAFEHCQGLSGWLESVFLPRLPPGTAVVIAGRDPVQIGPGPADVDPPSGSLELGTFSAAEAARLLTVRGMAPEHHDAVLAFTGGHPLALSLAATLPPEALPPAGAPWRPAPEVLASLLGALIGDVPSPAHRRALEVCAHAPHTTPELLKAVLGDAGLLPWLRQLPFADAGRHGVALHELVREAVDADLRWRDPTGYERMHHAIGAHLLDRVRAAHGPAETLAATRAVAHLQRYGPMAEWLTLLPQRYGDGYEDGLRRGDHDAIVAMTRTAEGDESAEIVTHWLRAQPESFRVYRRSSDDAPTGFLLWLRLPVGDPGAAAADPVTAAAWAHAERTRPLGAGEHLGLARFMIDGDSADQLSPAMHALTLRVYATWVRSERLAWSYVPSAGAARWERLLGLLGHRPTGTSVPVNGVRYALYGCDWRVTPRDVWFGLAAPAASAPAGAAPAVLSRPDFDTAVREALRDFHNPGALVTSPLLRTRMVITAAQSAARAATAPPAASGPTAVRPVGGPAAGPAEAAGTVPAGGLVEALRDLLTDAVDGMLEEPAEMRLHRVVATTFFHRLPTQVAAAERLRMPFSTYRRHLHRGLDRVCERLWQRESGAG